MKRIPSVKTVMTAFPYWIDVDEDIEVARQFMQQHNIRHLPVKENGNLAGVVTERDINRKLVSLKGFSGVPLTVRDVCTMQAYVVDIDEPLDNILITMAMERIGCALVVKGERLAGLFTMHDACRVFANDLRERFRPTSGNDAA